MSASGQERPIPNVLSMSVVSPTPDIRLIVTDGRKVPIAAIRTLTRSFHPSKLVRHISAAVPFAADHIANSELLKRLGDSDATQIPHSTGHRFQIVHKVIWE
jgi:hypothetical protein